MARLIYSALCSLDLYVADRTGDFSWAAPSEEVHAAVNELARGVGTMLLGRRMYQVLSVWETLGTPDQPDVIREFAGIWRDADKVVVSGTGLVPTTARTRVERRFDAGWVSELKRSSERDLSIGGPTLAGAAMRAGIVDQIDLFLSPIIVGGGLRALPDDLHQAVSLSVERSFPDGVVQLRAIPG